MCVCVCVFCVYVLCIYKYIQVHLKTFEYGEKVNFLLTLKKK